MPQRILAMADVKDNNNQNGFVAKSKFYVASDVKEIPQRTRSLSQGPPSNCDNGIDHEFQSSPQRAPDFNKTEMNGGVRPRTGSSSSQGSSGSGGRPVLLRKNSKKSLNGDDSSSNGEHSVQELLRRRSASVLEVKEHAHSRLREELLKAQQELMLKDEECKKLSHVQDQMGKEIEELTASLFEEANKMVQDAHIKRMQSEKLLKEANSKIEVLQAEVTALKTLVITSTPSMPNRHLHPQIDNSKKNEKTGGTFIKGHRRSTSHHNFNKELHPVLVTELRQPIQTQPPPPPKEDREVDPVLWQAFRKWREQPTVDNSCEFMASIIKEDVQPCLCFSEKELSQKVLESVVNNTVNIEPIHEKNPFPRHCALTNTSQVCKYRIRLSDSEPWQFMSLLARNRVIAVCDFYTYMKYITHGLVKAEERDIYWEICRLRKQMCLAKLGLS